MSAVNTSLSFKIKLKDPHTGNVELIRSLDETQVMQLNTDLQTLQSKRALDGLECLNHPKKRKVEVEGKRRKSTSDLQNGKDSPNGKVKIRHSFGTVKKEQENSVEESEEPVVQRDDDADEEVLVSTKEHSDKITDFEAFYESLRPNYKYETEQPKGLVNTLFPYQRKAVCWMLHRETGEGYSKDESLKAKFSTGTAACKGGILAEEMGLGKTLEILGLILSNPRYHERNHNVPKPAPCKESNGFVDSHCTLIIIPNTLMSQWKAEIHKHAPSLRVTEYTGILSLPNYRDLRAKDYRKMFRDYDVVLATYEKLREEVFFTTDHGMKLRDRADNCPKKGIPKSPLIKLRWWRVCMDEAQMTKSTTTQTARMAHSLLAVNRWCISGTPIVNGLTDLRGLLLFLGCGEFWRKPTHELLEFMRYIMWRHAKQHVIDEITIPPPQQIVFPLEYDDIESFCYNYLLEQMDKPKESEEGAVVEKEIGRTAQKRFFTVPFSVIKDLLRKDKKKAFSKAPRREVLQELTEKLRSDFYQSQLGICEALNDMAAIFFERAPQAAILLYYKALSLEYQKEFSDDATAYFNKFGKTDLEEEVWARPSNNFAWQQATLHTVSNLTELLEDEEKKAKLIERANITKMASLAPVTSVVEKASQKLKREKQNINKIMSNFKLAPVEPWYTQALKFFEKENLLQKFLSKLRVGFNQRVDNGDVTYEEQLIIPDAHTLHDVDMFLRKSDDEIFSTRDEVLKRLKLPLCFTQEEVESFKESHHEAEQLLYKYKDLLMLSNVETKAHSKDAAVTKMRKLPLFERLLLHLEHESILQFNKWEKKAVADPASKEPWQELGFLLEIGNDHFYVLDLLKKELPEMMNLWTQREKYLDTILQLDVHIQRPSKSFEMMEPASSKLAAQESICISKKQSLEYILQHNKEVQGYERFGTKVAAVFQKIQEIREKEPASKMLIFSQWTEALTGVADLLKEHQIKFIALKAVPGAAAHGSMADRIQQFKENAEVPICLLDTLKQATGLTLTQANHVFILDLVDDANERQAIGRVHRIGQPKRSFVYRYLFKEEATVLGRFLGDLEEM